MAAAPRPTSAATRWRLRRVTDRRGARAFAEAARYVYRDDPHWTPPLPSELQRVTIYQAAAMRQSTRPQIAAGFVELVSSARVRPAFAEAGFGRY